MKTYTECGEKTRLISAREATQEEKADYYGYRNLLLAKERDSKEILMAEFPERFQNRNTEAAG